MRIHNNNCDGAHCTCEIGEVKLYPLGGGANLILCRACWAHENRYRFNRGHPGKWPQNDWAKAKVYNGS